MTDERIRFEVGFKGGGTTGGELPPISSRGSRRRCEPAAAA